mgnify:CR=1 FL=1
MTEKINETLHDLDEILAKEEAKIKYHVILALFMLIMWSVWKKNGKQIFWEQKKKILKWVAEILIAY